MTLEDAAKVCNASQRIDGYCSSCVTELILDLTYRFPDVQWDIAIRKGMRPSMAAAVLGKLRESGWAV